MAALVRRVASAAPAFYRSLHLSSNSLRQCGKKCEVQSQRFAHIRRTFSSAKPLTAKERVTIHFVMSEGEKQSVEAKLGENLLDVIIENDIDIDGFGACEGTLACSTCHLIFKPADFDKIPDKPTDEELDMLDLAYGLQDTSRLGCQVIVTKDMDGWEVSVPEGVADAREP